MQRSLTAAGRQSCTPAEPNLRAGREIRASPAHRVPRTGSLSLPTGCRRCGGYAGAALLGVCGVLLAAASGARTPSCASRSSSLLGCALRARMRVAGSSCLVLARRGRARSKRARASTHGLPPTLENAQAVDHRRRRLACRSGAHDARPLRVAVEPQRGHAAAAPDRAHVVRRADRARTRPSVWALDVRLRRPRGFANPGGADSGRAHAARGSSAPAGTCVPARRLGRVAGRWLGRADPAVARAARAVDSPSAGRAAGNGHRRGTRGRTAGCAESASSGAQLSRSGTSHLMAISGLHIGDGGAPVRVAGGGRAAIPATSRRTRLHARCRGHGRCCGGAAVRCTGGGLGADAAHDDHDRGAPQSFCIVAATRAACGSSRLRCWRSCCSIRSHRLPAVSGCRSEPLPPSSPGCRATWCARRHCRSYLRTQAVVTLGLVPVLVAAFGSVSLVSVPVNLLAIPLYTLVIVPLVLLGDGGGRRESARPARWSCTPTAWLIEATWPLIAVPASWPGATWTVAALPPLLWVAAGDWRNRRARAAARACQMCRVCAARLRLPLASAPPAGGPGTGHGSRRRTGARGGRSRRAITCWCTTRVRRFRSGSDTGQLVVLPFLGAHGVRTTSTMLVISHDDDDHAGGAAGLAAPGIAGTAPISASGRQHYGRVAATRCRARRPLGMGWSRVRMAARPAQRRTPATTTVRACCSSAPAAVACCCPGTSKPNGERELLGRICRASTSSSCHTTAVARRRSGTVRRRNPAGLGSRVGGVSQSLGISAPGGRRPLGGGRCAPCSRRRRAARSTFELGAGTSTSGPSRGASDTGASGVIRERRRSLGGPCACSMIRGQL